MAPKLINAITRFLALCPYVVTLHNFPTKTRIEQQKGYILDLYYNETLGKYAYTLVSSNQRVVAWDNARHHPSVTTFPHHFHAEDGTVQPSFLIGNPEQDILQVVKTINAILAR